MNHSRSRHVSGESDSTRRPEACFELAEDALGAQVHIRVGVDGPHQALWRCGGGQTAVRHSRPPPVWTTCSGFFKRERTPEGRELRPSSSPRAARRPSATARSRAAAAGLRTGCRRPSPREAQAVIQHEVNSAVRINDSSRTCRIPRRVSTSAICVCSSASSTARGSGRCAGARRRSWLSREPPALPVALLGVGDVPRPAALAVVTGAAGTRADRCACFACFADRNIRFPHGFGFIGPAAPLRSSRR